MRRLFALGLGWLLALAASAPAHGAQSVVEHVRVASFDGVKLDGWIVRPPVGDRRPVVLWTSPYFGGCSLNLSWSGPSPPSCPYPEGDNPELWDASWPGEAVPVNLLLEHGYAVAIFSVRGSGRSEGCFSPYGRDEQRDQAFLVEWLAAPERAFSSGDVAMMGFSYHGTTPLEAAIHEPPHLRTIVIGGFASDPYGLTFSPQGATNAGLMYDVYEESYNLSFGLLPPLNGNPGLPSPDRLCPDVVKYMTHAKTGGFGGVRDRAFWEERRLIKSLANVRVPTLVAHGFNDGGTQNFQEDWIWEAMPNAPKRFLLGQQGHEFPNYNSVYPEFARTDWNDRVLAWLDRHLKHGMKSHYAQTGVVEYVDSTGALHRAKRWPPDHAKARLIPLNAGAFLSVPPLDKLGAPKQLLCETNAVITEAAAAARDTLIAGNPHVRLNLESNLDGGQVSVDLFDVAPGPACGGTVHRLTSGTADLRFHQSRYAATSFPVNIPVPVHIDLANLAHVLPQGHRLVAVVSFGDPAEYETFPHIASRLTVLPGSRAVLPVVS